MLIESIFCNWSGGCAIGSLGADTRVTQITYQNIYSQNCNQILLLKSNGGDGYVNQSVFRNFTGHSNAYTINLDAFWSLREADPGDGVEYDYLVFQNWAGTCLDGLQRPPISLACSSTWLCGNLEIDNFHVWTETGERVVYRCVSAYGLGACMSQFPGNGGYTSSVSVATMEPT